jgi:integrase
MQEVDFIIKIEQQFIPLHVYSVKIVGVSLRKEKMALKNHHTKSILSSRDNRSLLGGDFCMKGSIRLRKDTEWYVVDWYDPKIKKTREISRYRGERMYHVKVAQKLLATMQGDVENGTFRIEKYTNEWCDTVPYIREWYKAVKDTLKPGTRHAYKYAINKQLIPFFKKNQLQLFEIQYDTLVKLLGFMKNEKGEPLAGKTKFNVMMTLHQCIRHARKSRRIRVMPEFPERKLYNIVTPVIKWLPSERQEAVINAIPEEHQPIFWWMKYHLRRPGEAMALYKDDYDPQLDIFIIRRGISSRRVIEFTKTNKQHIIPCHSEFKAIMKRMRPQAHEEMFSPFFFTCPSSRSRGKRYSDSILGRLWKKACKKRGENIKLYDGTKKSTASQFVNELGGSLAELKEAGDWADIRSVEAYAQVELARKRELLERKIVNIKRKRK